MSIDHQLELRQRNDAVELAHVWSMWLDQWALQLAHPYGVEEHEQAYNRTVTYWEMFCEFKDSWDRQYPGIDWRQCL